MNSQTLKLDSGIIRYDADLFSHANMLPETHWFEPGHWESQGLVSARQRGRGTALTIATPIGSCVLRQYLRGGMIARFIQSSYLFTGYENSRPMEEFQVLEKLAELKLPSPHPVAAICRRRGITTTGALMTREIEKVRPLEKAAKEMDDSNWREVGRTIREFHDHGLVHADLTVRNILIQEGGKIFLVDFDRARFQAGATNAFKQNLNRLRRSMVKSEGERIEGITKQAWMQLLKGYE